MKFVSAVLSLLLTAAAARADDHAIEFPPSKYEGRELYRTIRAAAAGMRADAVEALRRRLGIEYVDRGTIRLRFADLAPEGVPCKAGEMAERVTETVDGKPVIVIVLHWEYLMTGQADARVELTHEFFHAVHREQLSEEAYVAIPRWVREGLALYVAEQGPDRLRYILAETIDKGPDALVRGLEQGEHDFDRYAEDYLAIRYVEDVYGAEKLRALAADIVAGRRGAHEAIREHTGEDWATFADHARRYARSAVRLAENGVRAHYLPAFEGYLKRDFAVAADGFRALLAAQPDSYAAGLAQYYLARCEFEQQRFDAARDDFRAVLAKYPSRVGLDDDAQYFLGQCAGERREWSVALDAMQAYRRDYPYGAKFLQAQLRAGRCQIELGRPAEALECLAPLVRTAAGSSLATEARAALEELVKRFPDAPESAAARTLLADGNADH